MKLSQKKKKAIERVSVFDSVFRELTDERFCRSYPSGEPFYADPPDEWDRDEEQLWDVMTEIEQRMKKQILEILEGIKQ